MGCSVHLFLYFTLDLQSCCVALPVTLGEVHLALTLHKWTDGHLKTVTCVQTCAAKVILEGTMKATFTINVQEA